MPSRGDSATSDTRTCQSPLTAPHNQPSREHCCEPGVATYNIARGITPMRFRHILRMFFLKGHCYLILSFPSFSLGFGLVVVLLMDNTSWL